MTMFKVGDKVRCIREHYDKVVYNLNQYRSYRITNVKGTKAYSDVVITGNGTREGTWWDSSRFEKVKPNGR